MVFAQRFFSVYFINAVIVISLKKACIGMLDHPLLLANGEARVGLPIEQHPFPLNVTDISLSNFSSNLNLYSPCRCFYSCRVILSIAPGT